MRTNTKAKPLRGYKSSQSDHRILTRRTGYPIPGNPNLAMWCEMPARDLRRGSFQRGRRPRVAADLTADRLRQGRKQGQSGECTVEPPKASKREGGGVEPNRSEVKIDDWCMYVGMYVYVRIEGKNEREDGWVEHDRFAGSAF